MRRTPIVYLLTLALGLSLANTVFAAATEGFFVDLKGALAYTPKLKLSGPVPQNLTYDGEYVVGTQFGYKGGPMRYSVEFLYQDSSADRVTVSGSAIESDNGEFSAGGRTRVYSALINVFYDFDNHEYPVVPYIGGGFGYANVDTGVDTVNYINTIEGNSDTFSYQGIVGVSYVFTENFTAAIEYRYFGTGRVTHNTVSSLFVTTDLKKRFQNHIVAFVLSYYAG